MDFTFAEPAPKTNTAKTGLTRNIIKFALANPSQWFLARTLPVAKYGTMNSSQTSVKNVARRIGVPGTMEAVLRSEDDGNVRLYVRFTESAS